MNIPDRKSTIVRLLYSFYDPESGRILIGDEDIHDVTLDSLKTSIGAVYCSIDKYSNYCQNELL